MQEEIRKERQKMILFFVEDSEYHPIKIKEMAVLLGVPKKERGEFHDILDELIARGKIALDRRGLICLPANLWRHREVLVLSVRKNLRKIFSFRSTPVEMPFTAISSKCGRRHSP